ncbi:MAG: potassium channel protein [Desulfobacterales bacterium]
MNSAKQIKVSLSLSAIVILLGTFGYMAIEGWTFLDALYMAVITVATVGYKEVHNISNLGRLFTIIFIFSGVGFTLYVAGAIVQFMVEGQIREIMGRRRLDKQISNLKDHYIVCGYGRIGRVLCQSMVRRKPISVVIIEKNSDIVPVMEQDKVLYIVGNASDEDVLLKAGIKRAKGLVAALATDMDNVYLALTARELAPELYIIARASSSEAVSKLRAAGATHVESPYDMGAQKMAQRIMRPTVTNFVDLTFTSRRNGIQMEEIPVHAASPLANVTLKDSGIRQNFHLIIIAIKKAQGDMMFNPPPEAVITPGDTVIAVGEDDNLLKLEAILNPEGHLA